MRTLTKDDVLKKIQTFNAEVVWLKKLANAQGPYRFLKDADIEILPWSAREVPGLVTDPWLFEDLAQTLERIHG